MNANSSVSRVAEECLRTRTEVPWGASGRTSMSACFRVWYVNLGTEKLSSVWSQHVITSGPDVIFKRIWYGDGFAVLCSQFLGVQLYDQFVSPEAVQTG